MQPLHFDIYIASKPQPVWHALTGAQGVAALYFGCHLNAPFERGQPYEYRGDDGKGNTVSHVEGDVLECVPNVRLSLIHRAGAHWQKGGTVFSSRLTYAMEDVGFATKLSVTHDQWQDGDPGHAHNQEGWPIFLSSIKSYVETGKPLVLPLG